MIVYQKNNIELHQNDCLQVLRGISNNSIDLIIADPPFNLNKEFDENLTDTEYFTWCEKWINECCRVLKPSGSLFLMTIQKHVGKKMNLLGQHLYFQNLIVWFNSSLPVKNKFCIGYQPILYYVADPEQYIFNYGVEKRISKVRLPYGKENKSHSLKDIWDDIPFISGGCMASSEAILRTDSKGKYHSAQMPLKLAERMIKYTTMENHLVLDLFAGSGTSLLATQQLNRHCIGIEKNPDYCKLIIDRLEGNVDHNPKYGQRTKRTQKIVDIFEQ